MLAHQVYLQGTLRGLSSQGLFNGGGGLVVTGDTNHSTLLLGGDRSDILDGLEPFISLLEGSILFVHDPVLLVLESLLLL